MQENKVGADMNKKITSEGTGCIHCQGGDALTHSTEEHDENFVAYLEPCAQPPNGCGAEAGEYCADDCPQKDPDDIPVTEDMIHPERLYGDDVPSNVPPNSSSWSE